MRRLTGRLTGTFILTVTLGAIHSWVYAQGVDLKFGVYTSDKPTVVVKQIRPVLNIIEQELKIYLNQSVKIKTQVMSGYEKGIDALAQGRVDFSRLGPASYATAVSLNPNIKLLAMEHIDGKKRFNGIICVVEDSAITSVNDLMGKRFAFGSEYSTIGRYLSQNFLVDNGIKAKDLAYYEYLGRHDKVGSSVALGLYDAGALKESAFNKLVKKGKPLRSIAKIDNITRPWAARADLDEKIFLALQQVLFGIKDSKLLQSSLKVDGFLPGTNEEYDFIRNAIEKNDAFFN